MRSNLRILVAAAAALLVAPVAMADGVDQQLKQMDERMQQLEDQLQATQDQLDHSQEQVARQQDVIEKAGIDRQAQSGLSSFYQSVEIGGWLAGSWWWNFNDPKEGVLGGQNQSSFAGNSVNGGLGGQFYPFHPDHNSFSVDQLWFEIEKPVTEESRAGFRADIVYGRTASILGSGPNRFCGNGGPSAQAVFDTIDTFDTSYISEACTGDNASDINVYQAYIQYLTPWGPTLKVGKFGTLLGAEVAPTIYNFNVTRGNLYTLLQPINHVGVLLEGDANGIQYGLGVVNDSSGADPDFNNAKHILAKIGYATESYSGVVNFLYGDEDYGNSTGQVGTVDLVLTADPTENFSAWFNFDYKFSGTGSTPNAWGAALAGRYAFTDRLGFALRGEFVQSSNGLGDCFDGNGIVCVGQPKVPGWWVKQNADIYGITGTFDYTIADNLVLKWETRYDYVDTDCGSFFVIGTLCNSNQFTRHNGSNFPSVYNSFDQFTRRSQVVTGLELTYQF